MSVFQFKQFAIKQSHSAMKVGTDSVLLGCMLEAEIPQRILDIGTGTGLLALMMAQRFQSALIDAIEIDENAAEEARFNCKQSNWSNRLTVTNIAFQDWAANGVLYDLIVSNPPYYETENHFTIEAGQRLQARQTISLSFDMLLNGIVKVLSDTGCCWMVLPKNESEIVADKAKEVGLFVTKRIGIHSKKSKPENRVVFQLSKQANTMEESDFTIYEEAGGYTNEYFTVTRAFLLWKDKT